MIQLLLIGAVGWFLYDTLANTYVVRDRKTGKRVKGSGYYYSKSRTGRKYRRYR